MTFTLNEAPFVRGGEGWKQAAHRLAEELAEARVNSRANTALIDAARAALEHLQELRDAWQRGVIDERDSRGGTRSNRNVSVEVALRKALTAEHDNGFVRVHLACAKHADTPYVQTFTMRATTAVPSCFLCHQQE